MVAMVAIALIITIVAVADARQAARAGQVDLAQPRHPIGIGREVVEADGAIVVVPSVGVAMGFVSLVVARSRFVDGREEDEPDVAVGAAVDGVKVLEVHGRVLDGVDLHDDQAVVGHPFGGGVQRAQGGQPQALVLRRGEEDDVVGLARRLAQELEHVAAQHAHGVAGQAGLGEVVVDGAHGGGRLLDEVAASRAAAQRLDADAAGTGEEVEHPGVVDVGAEDAEERLLGPVGDGARAVAWHGLQAPAAGLAGDHAHAGSCRGTTPVVAEACMRPLYEPDERGARGETRRVSRGKGARETRLTPERDGSAGGVRRPARGRGAAGIKDPESRLQPGLVRD